MSRPYDDEVKPSPHSTDAENAVLGAILLDGTTFESVKVRLVPAKFYDANNRKIYKAMNAVHANEAAIDLVTVTSELKERGWLDSIGGVNHLAALASAVPTASNVQHYVNIVHDAALKRDAIQIAEELKNHAQLEQDVAGFVKLAEQRVSQLVSENKPTKPFSKITDLLMGAVEHVEEKFAKRHENKGVTGKPSGLEDLDRMTKGFQNSDLIIVAARPSVGKTAFALNIAQNVGVRARETVAIFSLEMSAAQLVHRMISSEGNIDAEKIKTGYFEGEDWDKLTMAVGILSDANLFIDDTPGITVGEIRRKCLELKKERGLGMILIDYLQLVHTDFKAKNREQEVSEISRTLKEIAKELDVPVIALSQLSRGVEQRQDKRPMMSDLRESGSIEQDADIVAFLYRDDYYVKQSAKKNIIEIILAKHRNGPVGTVEAVLLKNCGKIVNIARQQSMDDVEELI